MGKKSERREARTAAAIARNQELLRLERAAQDERAELLNPAPRWDRPVRVEAPAGSVEVVEVAQPSGDPRRRLGVTRMLTHGGAPEAPGGMSHERR